MIPIIIGKIIDFIIIDNRNELKKLMIILLIIYLSKYIISITNDFNFNKIKEDINIKSKKALLDFIMNMPMENLNNFEKGELMGCTTKCSLILINPFGMIIMLYGQKVDIWLSTNNS